MTDQTSVIAWRAYRLPSPNAPITMIPEWALPALRVQHRTWAENANIFVIEAQSIDGNVGRFGPCSETTARIVADQIAPALLCRPAGAYRMAMLAQPVGRHRRGAHFQVAASAARLAVLDLWSKQRGIAITSLLGGPTRDKVPAYATALGVDTDHVLAPEIALWLRDEGFYGQKWSLRAGDRGLDVQLDARRLQRLREAVGPDTRLMVDALGEWTIDHFVRIMPVLAEFRIAWIEEPCSSPLPLELRELAHHHGIPVALGEHEYDPSGQIAAITGGMVDIWQPDIGWHGGLVEAITTADVARLYGIPIFPHGGALPAGLVFAGLLDEQTVPAVEFHLTQEPRRQACMTESIYPSSGRLEIRTDPGLVSGYRLSGSEPTLLAERAA